MRRLYGDIGVGVYVYTGGGLFRWTGPQAPTHLHNRNNPSNKQSSILNWRAARALGYRKGTKGASGSSKGGKKEVEGRIVTPEAAGEGEGGTYVRCAWFVAFITWVYDTNV